MFESIQKVGQTGWAALALVLLLAGLPVQADSLKRQGLPEVSGVTLIGVENGVLKYRTAAGDREVELASIEAIGIEAVPELAAGQKSLAAGQLRAAQRSLEAVWSNNRVDWIKHFAGFYLLQVYDQRGQPVNAATVFAQLASENAEVFFLSKPPLKSLEEANGNQKERITQQILAVAESSRGERRRLVQDYLRRVAGEDGPSLEQIAGDNDDAQGKAAARGKAKVLLPKGLWAVADRAGEAEGKWDAVELLSKGEHQAALDAIKPRLNAPGDVAPKLFIYGKALLGLADAASEGSEEQDKLYRDAGLAFMRIVTHFSRPGQVHALVVPARLEVAYIHQKIGRDDIAQRLLFGGAGASGLNLLLEDKSDDYPFYRARYYQVIGEDIPAEEPQP